MREIKFRAWNGERMLFMGKGGYCDFEIAGGDVFACGAFDFVRRNYPLMQFTGLQDKNGVDIYEGDLINVFFTSPDGEGEFIHDCIYSVSINSLGGASLDFVKLLWEDQGNNQYPIHTTLNSDELELDWLVKERNKLVLKVTHGENKMFNQRWITNNESRYFVNIGNIHQNPELIEASK